MAQTFLGAFIMLVFIFGVLAFIASVLMKNKTVKMLAFFAFGASAVLLAIYLVTPPLAALLASKDNLAQVQNCYSTPYTPVPPYCGGNICAGDGWKNQTNCTCLLY